MSKALMSSTKFLTTPSKIASTLDWRKAGASLLTMTVQDRNTVHLTVSSHPESSSYQEEKVYSINVKESLNTIKSLAIDHNICGLVVDWPLDDKTGRMGASCGLTMHTLDALAQQGIVCKQRPFCLWDGHHTLLPAKDDSFGRSSFYTEQPHDAMTHKVVISNHRPKDDMTSDSVWQDYCQTHWPHAQKQEAHQEEASTSWDSTNSFSYQDASFLDSWEQSEGYVQAAAL